MKSGTHDERQNAEGPRMGHYKSNVRDLEFNLFEVLGRQDVLGRGIYADVDVDAAKDILREVARLAADCAAAPARATPRGAARLAEPGRPDSLLDSARTPPVYDPVSQSV